MSVNKGVCVTGEIMGVFLPNVPTLLAFTNAIYSVIASEGSGALVKTFLYYKFYLFTFSIVTSKSSDNCRFE